MPRISDDIRHRAIEIGSALLISTVIYAVSFTSQFQRLELLSLDARFNLRPPIQTHPKIATIDIDDTALKKEGRWQDWTRDKHARIIDIVGEGGGALLGFDIYFSEESTFFLRPEDVVNATSLEDVWGAFRDYDTELAAAAAEAGNVYFIATFEMHEESDGSHPDEMKGTDVSRGSWQNLEHMLAREFAVTSETKPVDSLLTAVAPEAIPMPELTAAARGVGFAQIVKEADGVVRRYPTFIRCDPPESATETTDLFPSIALAMACDYLRVPLTALQIRPGEFIELPDATLSEGVKKDLRIPINAAGEMIINWAGDYEETFRHFPYFSLIALDERLTFGRIKKFLSTQDPALFEQPSELMQAVSDAFPAVENYQVFVAHLYGAYWYERLLSEDKIKEFEPFLFVDLFERSPQEAPGLYEDQKEVFENVRLHLRILERLSEDPDLSIPEIAEHVGMPEETIDAPCRLIRQLLANGGPGPADRPLYFLDPVTVKDSVITFDDLKDVVFFYGLTASGTHDLNPMPFSPRYPMVGALANVFNTIVTGQFIRQLSIHWRLPLFLLIGFCAGFILSSSTAIRGSLFTVLFLVAYLLFSYELFETRGVWIDIVGPIGIVVLSDAAIVWHKFSTAEKKRKFIKGAFEHYMNPAVVEEIAKNPDMLELGGKKLELTAFFSDVAGFTSISEKLSEHELVELLNEYLTEMTDIVLKHFGNLDKYEGDAIMAFFGAPIHFPDHAARACYTALEMQEKLCRLREKWKAEGRPELTVRIGINTGPMIVGNMGSRDRFDYTVMGDAVNLASRLEGVNKAYSTEIMISEFTLAHCKSAIITREIDLIRVKGKEVPVRIYEVLARAGDGLPGDLQSVIDHYSRGLEAYRQRKWEDGIAEFQRALDIKPEDGPSRTYIQRCREYREVEPPDDWDGAYIMTTK